MRWRKRFVRYTFEPYGIAVRREEAVRRGARKVAYRRAVDGTDGCSPVFVQSPGEQGDWTREREWRAEREFPLDNLDPEDCRVVVPDPDAAERVRAVSGPFAVHTLFIS